jgi:death-on-curing protein
MPEFRLRGHEGVNLFLSAVAAPQWQYFRTVHEKGAALFRSLIKNHPLVDGNKRLAVVALDVFFTVNSVDFKVTQERLVEAALAIAQLEGNFPINVLTKWIRVGCWGRPKSLVYEMAEQWPEARQYFKAAAREADRRRGRGARVPGRRVRVDPEFYKMIQQINKANSSPAKGEAVP